MQPIAIYSIYNMTALAIYGVEYGINNKVLVGLIDGDKADRITKNTIYTTPAGRDYIRKNGTRYYIDNFMRC